MTEEVKRSSEFCKADGIFPFNPAASKHIPTFRLNLHKMIPHYIILLFVINPLSMRGTFGLKDQGWGREKSQLTDKRQTK
jgi:hypothetical protein